MPATGVFTSLWFGILEICPQVVSACLRFWRMAWMSVLSCDNIRTRYLNHIKLSSSYTLYTVNRYPAARTPAATILCCAHCSVICLQVLDPQWLNVPIMLQATCITQCQQHGRHSPPTTTLLLGCQQPECHRRLKGVTHPRPSSPCRQSGTGHR